MPRHMYLKGRAALLAVTTIVSLACGSAIADDAVLLASTVPGYVPGMVVSSTDRLSLPEAASATLLFQSGEMLRLRGPFEGTLAQQQGTSGTSSIATLADMFRMHGVDATVIGGTRSTGPLRPRPSLDEVQVDPQRSGTYCVEPTTSIWLSRPTGDDGMYALRRKGSSRTIAWPTGAPRIEWPSDVPIEDGSRFEIAMDGTARATVIFRTMPAKAVSGPARVAAGLLLGCHEQFDDELRRVSHSAVGPELWMTTDHGRRPIYRKGERITLTVAADTDGYLYCVATRNDGSATPIFPAGAVDGAQLRGATPLLIPGRRQPSGLTATPELAQIRCWLADRDLSPELPHALISAAAGRIPDHVASNLEALFSQMGGTRVATDILTIRSD